MVPLTKDVMTIGRKQADILLDDSKVSSTHAQIERKGMNFILKDLKSTNGTFLNRKQITNETLADQDIIEIGNTTLCFYEDMREFHGQNEESVKIQKKPENDLTRTREIVTQSKTLRQSLVKISVVEGPDKGKKFSFKKTHIIIGRKDADVTLLDVDTSRAHAMIEVFSLNSIFLRDLDSTNGTFLNGKKISAEKLKSGDEINVGNTRIIINLEGVNAQDNAYAD